MTDNIIVFPKKNKNNTIENDKLSFDTYPLRSADDIENLSFDLTDMILSELNEAGFDIQLISERQIKDIGLLIESAKSLICRYHDRPHFLQTLADVSFETRDDGAFYLRGDLIINIAKQPTSENNDPT